VGSRGWLGGSAVPGLTVSVVDDRAQVVFVKLVTSGSSAMSRASSRPSLIASAYRPARAG